MKNVSKVIALLGALIMFVTIVVNTISTDIANRLYLEENGYRKNTAVETFFYEQEILLLVLGAVMAVLGLVGISAAARHRDRVPGMSSEHDSSVSIRTRSGLKIALWIFLSVVLVLALVIMVFVMQFVIKEMQHGRMTYALDKEYEGQIGSIYVLIFMMILVVQFMIYAICRLIRSVRVFEVKKSLFNSISHPVAWMLVSLAVAVVMIVLLIRTRTTLDMAFAGNPEIYTGAYARNEGKVLIASLVTVEIFIWLAIGTVKNHLRAKKTGQ